MYYLFIARTLFISLSNKEWEALLMDVYESIPNHVKVALLNRATTAISAVMSGNMRFEYLSRLAKYEVLPSKLRGLFYRLATCKTLYNIEIEQRAVLHYICIDLSKNPRRMESWLMLAQHNISQLDKILNFALKRT